MGINVKTDLPDVFRRLMEQGCLDEGDLCGCEDGFRAVTRSVADILARRDITTFPGESGTQLECGLFFDDWYLYAVPNGADFTYSLFKMREQEHDAKLGLNADGDIPGVTVCFIAMEPQVLLTCLAEPTEENRKGLGIEINRVVAYRGQTHDRALKAYFIRTEAQGPYLIAKQYTGYIASLAENGVLDVPERYAADYQKWGKDKRIPKFLEENNAAAGVTVCDHEKIFFRDPQAPTEQERLAVLATHTGNVSLFSFAAEVQFHARFLTKWAKIPIPIVGRSPYASAIRADMSIGDAEMTGPTPYYRLNSRLVKNQYACHKDRV